MSFASCCVRLASLIVTFIRSCAIHPQSQTLLDVFSARKLGARARYFSPSSQKSCVRFGCAHRTGCQNPAGFGPDGRNPLHLAARRGQARTAQGTGSHPRPGVHRSLSVRLLKVECMKLLVEEKADLQAAVAQWLSGSLDWRKRIILGCLGRLGLETKSSTRPCILRQ